MLVERCAMYLRCLVITIPANLHLQPSLKHQSSFQVDSTVA